MMKMKDRIDEIFLLRCKTDLVALAKTWPVAWLRISQSLRIPFFPDDPTHVSISTTSPLQRESCHVYC